MYTFLRYKMKWKNKMKKKERESINRIEREHRKEQIEKGRSRK